jgi:glycosyltransferase involved in cell wall biosynthesis
MHGGAHTLSVVIPVFNEQAVLPEFHRRLGAVLDNLPCDSEILFVNDGSSDASVETIGLLRTLDPRVALLDLSRNFGKEAAMSAGLAHAVGDAIVVIDADLQDPPELIPQLYQLWKDKGYDVVYAQRISRAGETWLKRTSAAGFYRLMQRVGRVKLPPNTGDFRLLSRRAVESLNRLPERRRFMKGLFAWIGYPQIAVQYHREPRFAGKTKWNYLALWNLSIEGITGFTTAPLKVATYLGLAVAFFALAYGLVIIYRTLVYGTDVAGYPSLLVVILFLGGAQLTSLGVLGEYVARIFEESKNRPIYLVQSYLPALGLARASGEGKPSSELAPEGADLRRGSAIIHA